MVDPADIFDETAGVEGAADAPGAAHAAAEGHESVAASSNAVVDALLSTHPSPPLESVESPFDLANGGAPRIARGLMKLTGIEGLPAVVDVFVGSIELYLQQSQSQPNDGAGEIEALPANPEANNEQEWI